MMLPLNVQDGLRLLLTALLAWPLFPVFHAFAESSPLVIRDDAPASSWDVGYPVGNGRLGATTFGDFPTERILLNEETIWARGPQGLMAEDSFEHLEKVRELEAAGEYEAADAHFTEHILAAHRPYSYQLLGNLSIEHLGAEEPTSIGRELDLATGVATTTIQLPENTINRALYASAVDDLIVLHLSASKPKTLNLRFSLSHPGSATVHAEGDDLVLDGIARRTVQPKPTENSAAPQDPDGTHFHGRVRIAEHDGKLTLSRDAILLSDATQATVLIAAATNFNNKDCDRPLEEGWRAEAARVLDAGAERDETAIRRAAIADHAVYFDRCHLDLGESAPEIQKLNTPARVERFRQGAHDDPDLIETYFQFGRYLLIASSRPGTLPTNLQGIWNPHLKAPWSSDFHLNINSKCVTGTQRRPISANCTRRSSISSSTASRVAARWPSGWDLQAGAWATRPTSGPTPA